MSVGCSQVSRCSDSGGLAGGSSPYNRSQEAHRIYMSASTNSGARLIADSASARDADKWLSRARARLPTGPSVTAIALSRHGRDGTIISMRATRSGSMRSSCCSSHWSLAQSSDVVLAGLSDELSAHRRPTGRARAKIPSNRGMLSRGWCRAARICATRRSATATASTCGAPTRPTAPPRASASTSRARFRQPRVAGSQASLRSTG
jgi:hypothetical protein